MPRLLIGGAHGGAGPSGAAGGLRGGSAGRQSQGALHGRRLRSGQLGQPPTTQEPMTVGVWGAADHLHGQTLYI